MSLSRGYGLYQRAVRGMIAVARSDAQEKMSRVLLSSFLMKDLMATTTGMIMLRLPKRRYITGMRMTVMMQRVPVLRIFMRRNADVRDAVMAMAAVTRAFSSQKKKNIATEGRRLKGYEANVPFSMFFHVRICISPRSKDRMSAPMGAW